MWIDFNDSFTVVTVKFLYTNVDLNLPHHLNYVAALPCKCTQRIVHVNCETVDLLRLETPDIIPPDLWHPNIPDMNPVNYKISVIMQHCVYQTKICNVEELRVIDVWCGLEQSTINLVIDH